MSGAYTQSSWSQYDWKVGCPILKSICVELDFHKVVITLSYFKISYTIGFLVKKRFYLLCFRADKLQPAKS